MATTTMNISLPDTLRAEVEEIAANDGYSSISELFRELARNYIKERQRRLEQEKLEAVLVERLRSSELMEFDIAQVRAELAKRLVQGKM